mgnify:CR=1 FL=1
MKVNSKIEQLKEIARAIECYHLSHHPWSPKVTRGHQMSKNETVHDRSNDLPNGRKFHEKSNEPIFSITRGQTILIYIYDAIIDLNAVACYRIRFGYNLITKTSAEYGKKLYIYAAEVVVIKLSTKCMLQH